MKFQLVPSNLHRTNAPERTISTFKDHFIAGMVNVDSYFPKHLWCRLLPLETTTFNLPRSPHLHPNISAEDILNGDFDYNKTPIASPGTKAIFHKTPANRKTWAHHGVAGWYTDRAFGHYR